jgi:glycosyltransferase involved in cell wall biosynthesis
MGDVTQVGLTPGTTTAPRRSSAPMAGACDLTVLILTYNETRHIVRAIESVRGIAREVIVVDSFSTDDTVALAEAAGARVLTNPFVNQARQFQWGLDHAGIESAWTMRLDADEIIEPDLAREIAEKLPALPADVVGVNFSRKHIFLGRWVRHGGRFPLVLLRLWRTGQGRIEDRWMDEHIVVHGGRTVSFDGGFADACLYDLTFFTDKHNKYATREAIDVLNQKYGLFATDDALNARSASRQAGAKRWVKEKIYNRLPFWVGPTGYFLYRYFLQLGFLDGRSGLIYHFLQGFWYRFLVGAKVVEYDLELQKCSGDSERLALLSRMTGHDLAAAAAAAVPRN